MTFSDGHLVRLDGGRLVLDFMNTANWSTTGMVLDERLENLDDARIWATALGLSGHALPQTIEQMRAMRSNLRPAFLTSGADASAHPMLNEVIAAIDGNALLQSSTQSIAATLLDMIAISAVSVLSDVREINRVKTCPGPRCAWVFIDETKNARRKWCSMQTCGNRAKAKRNYGLRRHTVS